MKTRRTDITIETARVRVVSRVQRIVAWCEKCGERADMVTVDDAALLARVPSRTIFRRVEAGQLHFIETTEGLLLVCLNSLSDEIQ